MADARPVLHLLCGKIASGKSTLAAALGASPRTVVISEDDWLGALFGDRMTTIEDYAEQSRRLRDAMAPHVARLLGAGVSVVLDFPANTPRQRAWMRRLIDETGCDHRLHVLEVSDALCLERLAARNAGGAHAFTVPEALFHEVTRHFTPPGADEGFTLVRHAADGS